MGGDAKVFTLAEVSTHNHNKDCWLIIDGKVRPFLDPEIVLTWLGCINDAFKRLINEVVFYNLDLFLESIFLIREVVMEYLEDMLVYDVTKFLEDHPGGDEVLLSATGKDASDDFEDVGHSTSARAMMDEYYVGQIDPSTIPTKTKYTPPKQPHYNQDKTGEFIIKLLQFLVPLAILGLAVGIRFYTKST
ncbi:hypothetical protein ACLOJK_009479 [Asimina triloba]